MSRRRRRDTVAGQVEARAVLKGTGSAHKGVVLTTPAGEELILQRVGGNAFQDPTTRALAGRRVTVEGYRLGGVFRFTRVVEEEPAEPAAPRHRP